MDELELLKKDWNKSEVFNTYSDSDIYPMLHKKSSSIVKVLFYISIAELIFWTLLNILPFFASSTFKEELIINYQNPLILGVNIFSYTVILFFIYLLYKSYKSISVIDSTKQLMESIIKTRKIVKYYIAFNLSVLFVLLILSFYNEYVHNQEFHDQIVGYGTKEMLILYCFIALTGLILVVITMIIYRLIYGVLLKRLNRNYNELKKLEI